MLVADRGLRKRPSVDQSSPSFRSMRLPVTKKVKLDPQSIDFLLTSPESRLVGVNFTDIINFSTWQKGLTQEDRDHLITLLPHDVIPGNVNANDDNMEVDGASEINVIQNLFKFNQFLHDCFKDFQEALAGGLLTPEAVSKRNERNERNEREKELNRQTVLAENDSWKDTNFESYYGQKTEAPREKLQAVAGDSKSVNLKEMCQACLIRKDDRLLYKRNFSAVNVMVDVEMRVVNADGTAGVSIQLGKSIFKDLETPTSLETKILDYDGRVPKDKRPNGNAFKSLKLVRGGEDLGRLFDVRKDYFDAK